MARNSLPKGMKTFNEIHGESGRKVLRRIEKICPDMAQYIVEYPFGKIYSRKGLDRKMRQVATIASLTALGYAPQLKSHIKAGIRVGLSYQEIMEVILQMTVYAGFPAALNALYVLAEVSREKTKTQTKKSSRW